MRIFKNFKMTKTNTKISCYFTVAGLLKKYIFYELFIYKIKNVFHINKFFVLNILSLQYFQSTNKTYIFIYFKLLNKYFLSNILYKCQMY